MKRLLLILLLLLAACDEPPEIPDDMKEEIKDNTREEADLDEPAMDDDETDDERSTLLDFMKGQVRIEYQVEYDMTTTLNGEVITSTMSYYMKGDRVRTDSEAMGIKSRMYVEDTGVTSCTMQDGEWMCLEWPKMEDDVTDMVRDNIDDYDVNKKPDRTIAGAKAKCFEVSNIEGTTMEFCYSSKGIPLYVKVTGEQMLSEQIATSYSTNVKDNVFDLPAKPKTFDMPEMPEGIPDMPEIPQ